MILRRIRREEMLVGLTFPRDPEAVSKKFGNNPNCKV